MSPAKANTIQGTAQTAVAPPQDPGFEAVPSLKDAPIRERLLYVQHLLIGLSDLLGDQQLAFLRYLVAMAVEESDCQVRFSERAGAKAPAGD